MRVSGFFFFMFLRAFVAGTIGHAGDNKATNSFFFHPRSLCWRSVLFCRFSVSLFFSSSSSPWSRL